MRVDDHVLAVMVVACFCVAALSYVGFARRRSGRNRHRIVKQYDSDEVHV